MSANWQMDADYADWIGRGCPNAGGTGPRGPITERGPLRPGNGATRTWCRTIRGTLYQFTAVLMPDGARCYFVSRFNGYAGGPAWGCAWDAVRSWTIRPTEPCAHHTDSVPAEFEVTHRQDGSVTYRVRIFGAIRGHLFLKSFAEPRTIADRLSVRIYHTPAAHLNARRELVQTWPAFTIAGHYVIYADDVAR